MAIGCRPDQKRGSNKGHYVVNLQYSCIFMGCHLRRRNVVEFAASHEAGNRGPVNKRKLNKSYAMRVVT